MPPALSTNKGVGKHLSHPSSPTPGHTPTLTPYKEQVRTPRRPPGSEQGKLLLVFTPSCSCRSPSKALPEFLVWPLVNFCGLGKAKNSGQYHVHAQSNGYCLQWVHILG